LVWENREPLPVSGGALATAGGLVFYGTLDGWLKALDQASGRELWKYKTPTGILGSPIAFLGPDGKQYIAILSGLPAGALPDESSSGPTIGVLTVFGL
jgi:alcohol dehydrogenase (cytochrome c)